MPKQPMKLETLRIHERYGQPGYRVVAEFSGQHKVELTLSDGLGGKIIEVCMDEIVAAIRQASDVTAESLLRGPEVAAKELEHRA